ncbi:hypothetical protein V6N12_018848 [Hibiscus sabdariffa]|uniref:Uncharacterized protein n=1 Tax=Hibiscus sabdariffa TaxID=183260 RepID=A0ABR2ATV1_9ROSI
MKLLLAKGSVKACRVSIFGTMNPEAKTSGPLEIIDITGTAAAQVSLGGLDGDRRHTSRIGQGLGTGVVEIGGEKVVLEAGHVKIFEILKLWDLFLRVSGGIACVFIEGVKRKETGLSRTYSKLYFNLTLLQASDFSGEYSGINNRINI